MTEQQVPLLDKDDGHDVPCKPFSNIHDDVKPHKRTLHARTILLGLTALIISLVLHLHVSKSVIRDDILADMGVCPSSEAIPVKSPRCNPWKNLSLKEAVDVRAWLFAEEQGLDLTSSDDASDTDNYIHVVEVYRPEKDLVVQYLKDGTTNIPRYAHAVIHHGPREEIIDYLIGPLPPSPSTHLTPLTDIYHNPIPYNARSTFNWRVLRNWTGEMMGPLDEVTRDLFNGSVLDGTLAAAGEAPMSYDGTWRRSWIQLRRAVPGSWLLGVDFYIYVDFTGTDPSLYKILKLVHDNTVYTTIPSLVDAWHRGELIRSLPEDTTWATRAIQGKPRDLDYKSGPRSVLFDGARYRVDKEEGWVSWLGWEFYTSFHRDMGLHLWDINFRGERIIYELSPQEAMAQYSGSDPHQASTVWLDRAFGMGAQVREVILGYDCPYHATLLDATVHESGSTTRRNAICVFERESGRPISRHTGSGKGEMGAVKGFELVVRSVSSVGNYDYIFDYTFQLDGTIEVRVSASGYLQGGVWNPEQNPYGHQIHHSYMGSLHDHIINYKIDFDVAGRENSFMKVGLEVEEVESAWLDEDDWGSMNIQQRMVRKTIERESMLEYPKNAEGAYVVYNANSTNKWGNPRGYTIHPGPAVHLTNLNSKRTEKNVHWAKSHLAVSRLKEDEPSSSSMWNINLPGAPPVDFAKFMDKETIEQEDLVVWANLGTHHIPRAEDAPNTLTNLATSYILLAPWNYNDYDVSIESINSVLLNDEGTWVIQEGVGEKNCVPEPVGPLEYSSVVGWDEGGVERKKGRQDWRELVGETNHGLRAWNTPL